MFWWKRHARTPADNHAPPDSPTPAHVTPAADLEAFGPVHRSNHIAYVPAREFSGVPGVGTGNLAYVPDFLLSGPEWFAGNTVLREANSIMIAQRPAAIVAPKTTLEGVGGVTAGQFVHQPLLAVNIDNGDTEVGQ